MTIKELDDEMDLAYNSALESPVHCVKNIDTYTQVRTDLYNGSRGNGFQILGTMRIGKFTFYRSRQHGPEAWRERDWSIPQMFEALEADYSSVISKGIAIGDITLAAQEDDRSKFTQLISLLREAEELQPGDDEKAAFRSSPVTIADIHGQPHSMSVQEARGLIVQYGMQLNSLWAIYAQRRADLQ